MGEHPAFKRTWWVNLYPNGQCTGTLCETKESALNRCTYTGDTPDAKQVEVRIVPAQTQACPCCDGTRDVVGTVVQPCPACHDEAFDMAEMPYANPAEQMKG